jgi:hypothetical protein
MNKTRIPKFLPKCNSYWIDLHRVVLNNRKLRISGIRIMRVPDLHRFSYGICNFIWQMIAYRYKIKGLEGSKVQRPGFRGSKVKRPIGRFDWFDSLKLTGARRMAHGPRDFFRNIRTITSALSRVPCTVCHLFALACAVRLEPRTSEPWTLEENVPAWEINWRNPPPFSIQLWLPVLRWPPFTGFANPLCISF